MAKLKNYFRLVIVLLSVCLFCLVVLIVGLLLENQYSLSYQEEIQYLTVCLEKSIINLSSLESLDSILINGGVIRIALSRDYLVDLGMVKEMENGVETEIDYLNLFLNYVGAFGWRLVERNNDIFFFSRDKV